MNRQPFDRSLLLRRLAWAGATIAAAIALQAIADVGAQTLTQPYPQTKPSAPAIAEKSKPGENVKSCSTFGAGFVKIPGTDACVKIGGSVTLDGTAGR